ncbi:MAG TPA: crosslink repair DNA glycosylase YcaQ family protein [Terriglobales bacterium]|nr:crosslink repair DNA glycosylase YcaQ family protein [Terriglobales bacterium]
MTDQELEELRQKKWRLDAHPVRTLEDARSFVESVGFCMMYPLKQPVLAPTFVGAWIGLNQRLPTLQHAFSDARIQGSMDLMVRLLRERDAYEANLFDENNNFLVAASIFPYFYALVGERNPKQAPKPGPRSEYSELACDAFEVIRREGPVSKQRMQHVLGGGISLAALDRALGELWSKLRITRVDYDATEGSSWDVLYRWSPDAVREGMNLSVGEALTALVSKYLDCIVAGDQQEVEAFFGNFVPRSRVKEAINALLAARELDFTRVGNRTLIQIMPPKAAAVVHMPEFRQKPKATRTMISPRRIRPKS